MEHFHTYVPTTKGTTEIVLPECGENLTVFTIDFHPILIGGDQLTSKQGRGAQRNRTNSIKAEERLLGLIPCAEDWHTKVVLLSVSACFIPTSVIDIWLASFLSSLNQW